MIDIWPDCEVAGEASEGLVGLTELESIPVDIVLVDFALFDITGAELIMRARKAKLNCKFVLLTGAPLDDQEREHLSFLADGFHHKEEGFEGLHAKIIAAHQSESNFNWDGLSENEPLFKADQLTAREREILQAIARGSSIEVIANDLDVSVGTVRKHRENIMQKLEISTSTKLVRVAMQIGQF